jgi:Fic family protein
MGRMVLRLPRARIRRSQNHDTRRRSQESWLLVSLREGGIQRAAAHIINGLLSGFEGKLAISNWAKLAECSHDTTLRDIEDLIRNKVLAKDAAVGRSTWYSLITLK